MGDRLSRVVVEAGQEVTKGEELAYLESYADRLAEKNLVASQLQEAQARRKTLQASGESLVQQARLRVKQVKEEEPFSVRAMEAKTRLCEAQLETANKELTRLKESSSNIVSQQQLNLQTLAVRQAEEELAAARALLSKSRTGYQLGLRAAQLQLRTAEADLVRSLTEIPIDSLQKKLALAEAGLQRTIIRAPRDGTILKIIAHAGETVGAQPILQMGDTRQMFAIAEVYETDRGRIHEGNEATITSPALPRELTGSVVFIGSIIAKNHAFDLNPTADVDRRVLEVKVRLDQSKCAADYINMQVTVTLTPGKSLP